MYAQVKELGNSYVIYTLRKIQAPSRKDMCFQASLK
jgi:hypothetical protein